MVSFMLVGGLIGGIISATWLCVYYFYAEGKTLLFGLPTWVETLFVVICPSSLLLLSDPSDNSVMLPIMVIVLNAVFYSLIGLLLWNGLYRSKVVLMVLMVIFLLYLYKIVTL